jgi:hypothetical protein
LSFGPSFPPRGFRIGARLARADRDQWALTEPVG